MRLFELFRIYSESKIDKNRFLITSFGIIKKDIKKVIDTYFLEVADTIIVIEDNVGWSESKLIKNIEIFERFYFEDPNPFCVNVGSKKIQLDSEGITPHVKESKFLNRMFDHENFWNYSENNFHHFLNDYHLVITYFQYHMTIVFYYKLIF